MYTPHVWLLLQNNVLVGEHGTAVLADFGLAKVISAGFGADSQSKRGWGTTSYMYAYLPFICMEVPTHKCAHMQAAGGDFALDGLYDLHLLS